MMKKLKQTSLVIAALTATLTFAQMANTGSLYVGEYTITEQKLSLTAWGNGAIAESEDVAFNGTRSIRISSRNFFQGGIIMMQNPVDLSSNFGSKDSLLQFAIKSPKTTGNAGGSGAAGTGRGSGSGGSGSAGSGAGNEGGGEPSRGGGDSPTGGSTATVDISAINKLRFVFTTSDNKKSEIYLPVTTSRLDARGWQTISLPLQAIAGFSNTNKIVKSIAVGSDMPATFFIGEARMITDSTPIYGDMNPKDENVGSNSTITFMASADAGSSILKYSWDFDASNGIDTEAEGQSVKKKFRKPGTYTVTLTISDLFKLKKPFAITSKVTVN